MSAAKNFSGHMREFSLLPNPAILSYRAAAFVSKPVRLVLNRPFFNGYEHIMATKLANYLRVNPCTDIQHIFR